jgi:hypothetical protein
MDELLSVPGEPLFDDGWERGREGEAGLVSSDAIPFGVNFVSLSLLFTSISPRFTTFDPNTVLSYMLLACALFTY